MEYEVIFCKDGVLRLKLAQKPLISLKAIQTQDGIDDFSFISSFWDYDCYFEDGLTISGFFSCISPWAEFFSKLTGKDIKGYIEECHKPTLISHKETLIDFITLSYNTDIEHKIEYDKSNLDLKNIAAWFNEKTDFSLTNHWNTNSRYMLNGYNKQQEEHYSLSASKMNEISHVPLFLETRHFITFHDYKAKEKMGDQYQTFSDNAVGIQKLKSGLYDYSITYIESEKNHNLQSVVRGFFELLHKSTDSRNQFYESLKFDLEALEEEHENAKKILANKKDNVIEVQFNKNKNLIKESEPHESNNVVPILKTETTDYKTNSRSGIKEYFQSQEAFIDKHIAHLQNSDFIRIGKVTLGKPPQTRIGPLIKKED